MRKTLKAVWNKLPVSPGLRRKVKSLLPYALTQPHPALRRFGTVDDLYPWLADETIDTRLYLQNYFSVFFPSLDTSTTATVRLFDAAGNPLAERSLELGHFHTADLSIRDWTKEAGLRSGEGTLLWHIALPEAVAARPECQERHAYFTDRGYIAFTAPGGQTCFMHGIDRYAVFQEKETRRYDFYYPKPAAVAWRPEIPLGSFLGCETLEVLTVNRSPAPARVAVGLLDESRKIVASEDKTVPARGLYRARFDRAALDRLTDACRLDVTGLPTAWSRVMIFRRFESGAVSAMHC